jgi:hypothetical protein
MTLCSAADASVVADYAARTAANTGTHPFGPYIQQVPENPWNNLNTVGAIGGGLGWEYNEVTGDIYINDDSAPATVDLVTPGAAL